MIERLVTQLIVEHCDGRSCEQWLNTLSFHNIKENIVSIV